MKEREQWNNIKHETVNKTEREGGEDIVKHVLGRFLSRPDQYRCNQSCYSKSRMQPHKKQQMVTSDRLSAPA